MDSVVVHNMVEKLKDKYIKLWWDTDKRFLIFKEEIGLKEKMLRENHMNNF